LLLIFQLRFLFFWFFIFVLGYFVKVLFVFNSIIQSQFVMYFFFNLVLFFLVFFPWLFYKNSIGFQFHI
jgi:hypothetical protein